MGDGDMRLLDHSKQIDLSDWELEWESDELDDELDEIMDKIIARRATDIVEEALQESPPWLTLPYLWGPESDGMGGPPVADPLTIHLRLPFGKDEDGCTWQVTLEELLTYAFFEITRNPYDSKYEPIEAAIKTAQRLRELATLIETGPIKSSE